MVHWGRELALYTLGPEFKFRTHIKFRCEVGFVAHAFNPTTGQGWDRGCWTEAGRSLSSRLSGATKGDPVTKTKRKNWVWSFASEMPALRRLGHRQGSRSSLASQSRQIRMLVRGPI